MTITALTPPAMPPTSHPLDAETDIEVMRVVPERFSIIDESSANWLVKKVIAARQYGERVQVWCEQERRRAEREEMTLMFLFGRQIEAYAKAEIEKLGGRRKSICLPAGSLCFRRQTAKLVIDDEPAVLNWARANLPSAIQHVEKLMKCVLNQHFVASGELPDSGVHIEPEGDRFRIS